MTYEGIFDVVIEGAGSRRSAKVVSASDGLYVDDHEIPHSTLLGVALRGSILLVAGTQVALAIRGDRGGLSTLASELRRHADLGHLAADDREVLQGERVVFSTPVAVSGSAGSEKMKGLALAVVTDSALHLLERGGSRTRIPWTEIGRTDMREARFGRLLGLGSESAEIELLYLTDGHIQTIRGLAGRQGGRAGGPSRAPAEGRPPKPTAAPGEDRQPKHSPPPAEAGPPKPAAPSGPPAEGTPEETAEGTPGKRVEEAGVQAGPKGEPEGGLDAEPEIEAEAERETVEGSRDEVLDDKPVSARRPKKRAAGAPGEAPLAGVRDPVRHFEIPEFEHALGGVGTGADRQLGAALARLETSAVLPAGFLDEHLRELRSLYNGALVKRKREAAAASHVGDATRALDGDALGEEVRDRVGAMADALLRAYERQARRLAADRRIPWRRARKKYMPERKQVTGLRQRLARGLAALEPALEPVSEAGAEVRKSMETRGPPLERARLAWIEKLRELDRSYAVAWSATGKEIVGVWEDTLLPRLERLASERRRWLPWALRVAIYFVLLVLVATAAYLFFTGRLTAPPGP